MKQIVCDRCNRPGGHATLSFTVIFNWTPITVNKDICTTCFNILFPEWKEKEKEDEE